MAKPKIIEVKESLAILNKLLKSKPAHFAPRIRMLIHIKEHKQKGISKRELAKLIGVNPNSIQKWRTAYIKGGISLLLNDGRKGFKPSVITNEAHEKLEELLSNPENGIQGYKELQDWYKKTFRKAIKYTTLVEYCKRHWDTKIKVARKSHIKKDEEKEKSFKNTSLSSSTTQ